MSSVAGQPIDEAVAEMLAVLTPRADDGLAGAGRLARVELLDNGCARRARLGLVRWHRSPGAPPPVTSRSISSSRQTLRPGRFSTLLRRAAGS